MDAAIRQILDFVEGRIEPADFEQVVYNDPEIERALEDDPDRSLQTYVGRSLYQFLIRQDFSSPGDLLTIHGALRDFLVRKGVESHPTERYAQRFDLVLKCQPAWLSADDYVETRLLPQAGDYGGKDLQAWLHQRLLEDFKFATKPPKWIQNPEWPIGPNGPLVFLGQLKLRDYFHDEAAVYVFHDPTTGECQVVIQVE